MTRHTRTPALCKHVCGSCGSCSNCRHAQELPEWQHVHNWPLGPVARHCYWLHMSHKVGTVACWVKAVSQPHSHVAYTHDAQLATGHARLHGHDKGGSVLIALAQINGAARSQTRHAACVNRSTYWAANGTGTCRLCLWPRHAACVDGSTYWAGCCKWHRHMQALLVATLQLLQHQQ